MVKYEDYGKNGLGVDLTRAYSDEGFYLERAGKLYVEAVDPKHLQRVYNETDVPIGEETATSEDYEAALQRVGVEL